MLTTRLASVAAYNSVPSSQVDTSNNKTSISSANLQGGKKCYSEEGIQQGKVVAEFSSLVKEKCYCTGDVAFLANDGGWLVVFAIGPQRIKQKFPSNETFDTFTKA